MCMCNKPCLDVLLSLTQTNHWFLVFWHKPLPAGFYFCSGCCCLCLKICLQVNTGMIRLGFCFQAANSHIPYNVNVLQKPVTILQVWVCLMYCVWGGQQSELCLWDQYSKSVSGAENSCESAEPSKPQNYSILACGRGNVHNGFLMRTLDMSSQTADECCTDQQRAMCPEAMWP